MGNSEVCHAMESTAMQKPGTEREPGVWEGVHMPRQPRVIHVVAMCGLVNQMKCADPMVALCSDPTMHRTEPLDWENCS